MTVRNQNLVAIVGPTGSGKTDLSIKLAKKFDGEIVCADSRTVYRYMDIGTAKPDKEQLLQIPHHLLDVVQPGETLGAARFKELAMKAIAGIQERGRLPFLVGGSGLWIDAVLYDYQFPPEADTKLRVELEQLSDDELLQRLDQLDPEASQTVDRRNRRRIIRAIETAGQPRAKSKTLRPQTLVIGLAVNKDSLRKRIVGRVENMLGKGFIAEVQKIGSEFGWESEAMTGIGYRAFKDVIRGHKTLAEAKADFIKGDMALAKKQMTWLKRNQDIRWLDGEDPAAAEAKSERLVSEFLAN